MTKPTAFVHVSFRVVAAVHRKSARRMRLKGTKEGIISLGSFSYGCLTGTRRRGVGGVYMYVSPSLIWHMIFSPLNLTMQSSFNYYFTEICFPIY